MNNFLFQGKRIKFMMIAQCEVKCSPPLGTPMGVMKVLSEFINSSVILPLDAKVVKATIELCRKSKIKLPDAIIAATALARNLTLLTRNVDDFKNIPHLEYVNPWEI